MSSYEHRDDRWLEVFVWLGMFAAGAGYLWIVIWARDALSPGEWWWSVGFSYVSVGLLVFALLNPGSKWWTVVLPSILWLCVVLLGSLLLLVVLGGGSLVRRLREWARRRGQLGDSRIS